MSGTNGFTRRSSARAGAVLLAATLALGLAKIGDVARADGGGTPVEVGAYGCIVVNGGHRTVPAGSSILVTNGWATTRFGSVPSFLEAQTSIVSVDDGAMIDVSRRYTTPEHRPDGSWVTSLRYPTGVTLASGESLRFTFTLLADRQVVDTSDLDGDGNVDPIASGGPGLWFGGTCTVTAA